MGHQPSSGQPYSDPGNPENLYFSVSGQPKKVNTESAAKTDWAEPDEGDAALNELGAGIKKKTRSRLASEGQRVSLPTDPDGLLSIYNKPATGRSAD